MQSCPICGKEYDAALCSNCSFDQSCNYESFPTFGNLPGTTLSVAQKARNWNAKFQRVSRQVTYCPHCGTPSQYEHQLLCHNCNLFVDSYANFRSCIMLFREYLQSDDTEKRNLALCCAEEAMHFFEYVSSEDAASFIGYLSEICYTPDNSCVTLFDYEKAELRYILKDAKYLLSRGKNTKKNYWETNYPFKSSVMRDLCRIRKRDAVYAFSPFDVDHYLHWSQDAFFLSATKLYAKGDYADALFLFETASTHGNVYAATRIGMMYYYGDGCSKNYDAALEYFKRGARNGCPLAAVWISEFFRLGYGVESDEEYAKKLYLKAVDGLREMCNAGDASAMYFLGYNLLHYIFGYNDNAEAIRLLRLSHEQGEKRASIKLAECYLNGWGVLEDNDRAFRLLIDNPMPADKLSHFLLGRCYYNGLGTAKDPQKAFSHFQIGADLGYGPAKDYLGSCYYHGVGTEIDYHSAASWFKDAADNNGMGFAAYHLALMYWNGKEIAEDKEAAVQYFLQAAEQGIIDSQILVSTLYLSDEYLDRDYEKARMWMEKAAQQGNPEAQCTLARYYVSGFGFDDYQKAFEWFMKAAQQGYPEAEHAVGGFYCYNVYVDTDYEKANSWFERGAAHGNAASQYELGISYLEGRGTAIDPHLGMDYLIRSANAGYRDAYKKLSHLYFVGIKNYMGEDLYFNDLESMRYAKLAAQDDTDADAQFSVAQRLDILYHDMTEAEIWYQRAIEVGHIEAKLSLSKLYIQQKRNLPDAFRILHEIKSENTDPKIYAEAQYWISVCLENGYGCSKDTRQAKKHYSAAIKSGYVDTSKRKKLFGLF